MTIFYDGDDSGINEYIQELLETRNKGLSDAYGRNRLERTNWQESARYNRLPKSVRDELEHRLPENSKPVQTSYNAPKLSPNYVFMNYPAHTNTDRSRNAMESYRRNVPFGGYNYTPTPTPTNTRKSMNTKKRLSKRAIPTQRTSNSENKYGI